MKLDHLKELVEKAKVRLYKHMNDEEYVSPDMLDDALLVIGRQNKYIEVLEEIVESNK